MTVKPYIISAVSLAVCMLASGCGIAAKVNARNDLEQSKAEYKECLHQNPQNISACEALRTAYETDLKTFNVMSSGIQQGHNSTVHITDQ
jgi:hypothetical protein